METSGTPSQVKAESERIIQALGGAINPALPWLERTDPRPSEEVAARALVMSAVIQIYFGAPIQVIDRWIASNHLRSSLSRREAKLLASGDRQLTEQERIDLYWYVESIWTLVWAGGLVPDLAIDGRVSDDLARLLPNLQVGESGDRFRQRFVLRPFDQLYQMLDLYYRAHWYARDGQLRRYATGVFELDVIMERRKALEWVCDRQVADWDDAPDGT